MIGLALPLLLPWPAASQPSCAEVVCTQAIPITSHAVTADDYPVDSVRQLERGVVRVRYVIDEMGDVTECNVGTSSGYPRLDAAACALVRRWTYKPATAGGQAVTQNTTANIVFDLTDFPGGFARPGRIPPPPPDASQPDPIFDIPESYVPPSGGAR
jgi:TonB family protein